MNNSELEAAIAATYAMIAKTGTGDSRYAPLVAHFKALLEIQRKRAETVFSPDFWLPTELKP